MDNSAGFRTLDGVTEFDQHPQGRRIDVQHACPECGPWEKHPFCINCWGTNLVTTAQLAAWQRRVLAETPV